MCKRKDRIMLQTSAQYHIKIKALPQLKNVYNIQYIRLLYDYYYFLIMNNSVFIS